MRSLDSQSREFTITCSASMHNDTDRYLQLAKWHVDNLALDLNGLTVLTECASHAYGFLPVLAALAGAQVHAAGRDSSYGKFEANKAFIDSLLQKSGLQGHVVFHDTNIPEATWKEADIITNSGFLRPLSQDKIERLHETAVIPLMWETWEFRKGEIDIEACQRKRIPVIGTNEHYKHANMFPYPGMLALKCLFEAGLEVANTKIVLLGAGLTGKLIARTLKNNEVDFWWFGSETNEAEGLRPYHELKSILSHERIDALLVADHVYKDEVLGSAGFLDFHELKNKFPFVKLCHICGNVNAAELKQVQLEYFPDNIKPFGYMSYETINLGWEPVILLGAAGLKVGEISARARRAGKSIEETIREAVEYGIGMDFEGGFMNFKC
jgi:hypothetical protein